MEEESRKEGKQGGGRERRKREGREKRRKREGVRERERGGVSKRKESAHHFHEGSQLGNWHSGVESQVAGSVEHENLVNVTFTGHTNSTEREAKKMEEGKRQREEGGGRREEGGGRREEERRKVRVAHLLRMGSTNWGSISARNTEH